MGCDAQHEASHIEDVSLCVDDHGDRRDTLEYSCGDAHPAAEVVAEPVLDDVGRSSK